MADILADDELVAVPIKNGDYHSLMKTTKVNQMTQCIPQKGKYWCVPACVENLLRSEGVMDMTQEDIIYEYLGSIDPPIKVADGIVAMNITDAPKDDVMELYREKELAGISFAKLEPLVNDMLRNRSYAVQISYTDGIVEDDYISEVESCLNNNNAVLVSARSNGDWHITMVYESRGEKLFHYDPATDHHSRRRIESYKFSNDIMYCK
jgi:hypothetical protein